MLFPWEYGKFSGANNFYIQRARGLGFGLEELKLLWNTINEIAVANNIPLNEAQQKFFKDVEEQYDKKLDLNPKCRI
jgi:predicted acetyltransferase